MDYPIPVRKPDGTLIRKKKRVCHQADFLIPADYREKIKESKNTGKYLNLARELKRLQNMKIMVMPIIVGVFGMVLKILEKRLGKLEIRGRIGTIQTIQTTALLRLTRILRRVLET